MLVHVLKENLAKGLSTCQRFVASRSHIPGLSYVGIETKGKQLYISATNSLIGVRVRVGAKVVKEGALATPGKLVADLVQSLSLGMVEMRVEAEESDILVVKTDRNQSRIQGLSMEEFPGIEDGEKVLLGEFSTASIAEIVERVMFALSNDDSRPILTGVFWLVGGGKIVATDGYRLSVVTKTLKVGKSLAKGSIPDSLVIPGTLLSEAVRVFLDWDKKTVGLYYDESLHQLSFRDGDEDVVVVGRILQGEYPAFEAIIPKTSSIRIWVQSDDLIQAVKTSSLFAKDSANIVTLNLLSDSLQVVGRSSQVGDNKTEVAYERVEVEDVVIESDGEKSDNTLLRVSFNSRYLIDYLSRIKSGSISLSLTTSLAPVVFKVEENEGYRHIIMPMRID